MSSWFKVRSLTGKKDMKSYENMNTSSNSNSNSNSPDSYTNSTVSMFASQEGEEISYEKSKKIGSGDLSGKPSDLNFCCLQDGAIDCFGFDKFVLCEGETEQTESRKKRRSKDEGQESEKLRIVARADDENNTGKGSFIDKIRSMGPIRDRSKTDGDDKGVKDYLTDCKTSISEKMTQCIPEKSSKAAPLKKSLRIVLVMLLVSLLAIVAGIVAVALNNKKKKRNSGPNAINGFDNSSREDEIKDILNLTPTTQWQTEGSPQHNALKWLFYEDPQSLSAGSASDREIQERYAAATLYYTTNGKSWKKQTGFLGDKSICEWNAFSGQEKLGIFCGENGTVNKIHIVSNSLSGNIPKELNYFTDIVELNLYYNRIAGFIPDLSSLVKLEKIDLDSNQLTGLVPESIFNLPSITNLFLLQNKGLMGRIPDIENSSKLEAMSLQGCSFSGTIPQSLGTLTSLKFLQLKDNKIEGEIPFGLMSSPNLETLGLAKNKLSGNIPRVRITGKGTKLESLALGSNSLQGSLPEGLDDLTSLKFLYLEENQLKGEISDKVLGLPNLEQLFLHTNQFKDDISFFLSESRVLADVYLHDNDFSGDLQDFLLFAPSSTEKINLSGNRDIEGYIPREIANFGKLKYFNVSDCFIGGQIPSDIGRMNKLETLDLSKNHFQGYLPDEMSRMNSLTSFDISQNRDLAGDLSGSFCEDMGEDVVFAKADCAGDIRIDCDCCTHCCSKEGECSKTD